MQSHNTVLNSYVSQTDLSAYLKKADINQYANMAEYTKTEDLHNELASSFSEYKTEYLPDELTPSITSILYTELSSRLNDITDNKTSIESLTQRLDANDTAAAQMNNTIDENIINIETNLNKIEENKVCDEQCINELSQKLIQDGDLINRLGQLWSSTNTMDNFCIGNKCLSTPEFNDLINVKNKQIELVECHTVLGDKGNIPEYWQNNSDMGYRKGLGDKPFKCDPEVVTRVGLKASKTQMWWEGKC